ncbi:MAG: TetR/AcrR family transcriptional regulator [Sphingobium sp.]
MSGDILQSEPDAGPVGRDTKGTRTRERILECAAIVLKERGYASTRLSDVAKIAAIRPTALYYHFDSRETLIEEVVTLGQQRVYDHVAQALEAARGLDPIERIRLAVRAHLEMTLRDSNHASAAIRTLGQLPAEIREKQLVEQRRYGDLWRHLIADGVSSGQIGPGKSVSAMRMLALGALNWIPEWWNPQHGSLEDIIQTAEKFILDGLKA